MGNTDSSSNNSGCSSFFDAALFRANEQRFVIDVIKAEDIPKMDTFSESDPYVKFSVLDANKKAKQQQQTPTPATKCATISSSSSASSASANNHNNDGDADDIKIQTQSQSSSTTTTTTATATTTTITSAATSVSKAYSESDNSKLNLYEFETLFRMDNRHPIWNCRRIFKACPDSDYLDFDVWEMDFPDSDDYVGRCVIKCSDIELNELYVLDIELSAKNKKYAKKYKPKLHFRVLLYPNINLYHHQIKPGVYNNIGVIKKTLILMRHGESEWNEAQHNKKFINMVKTKDHPLNEEGINQALNLNQIWRSLTAITNEIQLRNKLKNEYQMSVHDFETFLNSELILVSPLCRALQTALLTLLTHNTMNTSGLRLCRNLREIKNTLGSCDTMASKCGRDIYQRCLQKLFKYADKAPKAQPTTTVSENENENDNENESESETEPATKSYLHLINEHKAELQTGIDYDTNDTLEKWWTVMTSADNRKAFEQRLVDMMYYIWFLRETNIMCVGHSLWIKGFFKYYLDTQSQQEMDMFNSKTSVDLNEFCSDLVFEEDADADQEIVVKSANTNTSAKNNSNAKPKMSSSSKKSALMTDLRMKKMCNAGCIRVDVEFSENFEKLMRITDVTLLFGSKLV